MSLWKSLLGTGSLALAIVAAAAAAQDKPGAVANLPEWAFPGSKNETLPGSKVGYSKTQMFDRTGAVDWYPDSHPPMPAAVRGHPAVLACGYCHLPQGSGRSENASLAGLPAEYIIQQVADFNAGLRKGPDRKFGPAVNMETVAKGVRSAEVEQAANYFAGLKYTKHLKLLESADIPAFSSNGFVYVIEKSGARTPLGDRIIEGPDDFERFEMRDPNITFTAYVPVGSVARGAALATKSACEACHGPGLKGGPIGPPIAGRLPTGMFRQLYGFQIGTRNGAGAASMKPIVEGLSHRDMIDLAAYVSSLEP